jgi:hypothetical protein
MRRPMVSRALTALMLVGLIGLTAGCGKENSATPPTPPAGALTPVASPGIATAPSGTPVPPTGIGSDVPSNLFQNGSFESGPNPWISLTTEAWGTPFAVSSEQAHSGQQSALLELRAKPEDTGPKVFGVVQEMSPPAEFPEVISGYYWVENWERGAPKQYLQFVIIAFGANNLPGGHVNHQIRYVLAGVSQPPLEIANAKYIFLTQQDPPTGQWVHFEVPVSKDFAEQWGDIPKNYQRLRLLFEVRYDDKPPGAEAKADAFYDDLYMGPAQGDPNRP